MCRRLIRQVTARSCERAAEKHARLDPVALHGSPGYRQRVGRFVVGQTAKETTIDDAREARFDAGKPIDGVAQLEHRLGLIVGGDEIAVERDLFSLPSPFFGETSRARSTST